VFKRAGKPLISILMLCYNHEQFIAEAVEGVLAQTYEPLEIVIIDDCSQDGTAAIIRAKLAEDRRSRAVFVQNPRNMNPFAATRLGLEMVKGDFIVASSSDDIMLPEMVEEIAKVWIRERVSLVTANAYYIDENSKLSGRTFRDPSRRADDSFETLARDGSNACCFGAGMGFEREIYTTFGWPPEHLGTADILVPYYAYLLKGARFIEKPLLKYRVHPGNSSLSLIGEKQAETGRLLTLERGFFQHLAHALLMQQELERLGAERPDRYADMSKRIAPLLTVQIVEMAKKLVGTRIKLQEAGVKIGADQFAVVPAAPEAGSTA
jgi:glycosyltransferase involved in cell wall biosynthesis